MTKDERRTGEATLRAIREDIDRTARVLSAFALYATATQGDWRSKHARIEGNREAEHLTALRTQEAQVVTALRLP